MLKLVPRERSVIDMRKIELTYMNLMSGNSELIALSLGA